MRVWLAAALAVVGCGSSGGGSPVGGEGGASGGSSATGGAAPAGGTGGGGMAGRGGAGGGGGTEAACTGLNLTKPAQPLYTVPAGGYPYLAGSDSQGILVAVDVGRAIRVVSATPDGAAQVLLDETTYQKSWAFDPTAVVAIRRTDGVDVLVSDQSYVVLVRKQGASVRLFELAETNDSDLSAMALAAGSNGTLAVFQAGQDTPGTSQKITAVDVDPLIAAAGSTPANISLAQPIAGMAQATRSFPAPAAALAVATPTQVWLTIQRMTAASDCQDTGQTATCSGGNPAVPWLDCTWHVDAFKLESGAQLPAAATATVDSRVFLHQRCGDTTPVAVGAGADFVAIDPATGQLGLALIHQTSQTASDMLFALLDASGAPLFQGPQAISAGGPGNPWALVRGGHFFYCSSPTATTATCWNVSAAGVTSSTLSFEQIPMGTAQTATDVGLVESMYNSDSSPWFQPLDCAP